MRILHIVTMVSPDGSYGGPTTVAVNQLTELQSRGEQVRLVAGARGYGPSAPDTVGGVPATLFRVRRLPGSQGFSGLLAPAMLIWLIRHGRRFDVAHLHLSRDPIMLLAAQILMWLRVPLVVQTHGMVIPTDRRPLRMIDALVTRRILRRARQVVVLNERERAQVVQVAGGRGAGTVISLLTNGVLTAVHPPEAHTPATQPGATAGCEVAFLARLHARKRPLVFVDAAVSLLDVLPDTRFTLIGPDGGEGPAVRRAIENAGRPDRLSWEGPVAPDRTVARLARADVYVLPAVDEPLGMSVLEAMTQGVPVVVTDSCGLAPAIRAADAGLVVAPDSAALAGAICTLVGDEAGRRRYGENGRRLAVEKFSIAAVVDELQGMYGRGRRAA